MRCYFNCLFGSSTLLFFVLLLSGCTGSVGVSNESRETVESLDKSIFIKLLNNSTSTQAICTAENELNIHVSVPAGQTIYCRDVSRLMPSYDLGPVCPSGVEVRQIVADRKLRSCQELQVCGVQPQSVDVVAEQYDGTPVSVLNFKNLPWGCLGKIEIYADAAGETLAEVLEFEIIPPSCRFCVRSRGNTCAQCDPLKASETIVAGVVVPKTCDGGCSSCSLTDGSSLSHGKFNTFYSRQSALCGQPCTQISQDRVCNNGALSGTSDFSNTQCMDVQSVDCKCQLPTNETLLSSDPSTKLYRSGNPVCGGTCSDALEFIEVRCESGVLINAANELLSGNDLSTFLSPDCDDSQCIDDTLGLTTQATEKQSFVQRTLGWFGFTAGDGQSCTYASNIEGASVIENVPHGASRAFHNAASGTCSSNCGSSARTIMRTCDNQSWLGDSSFSFPTCTMANCGCILPLNGLNYDAGSSIRINKSSLPSCGLLCNSNTESVVVTCEEGEWLGSDKNPVLLSLFDTYSVLNANCTDPVCDCSRSGRTTIPGDGNAYRVYTTANPTCPKKCNDASIAGQVKCNSGILTGDITHGVDNGSCIETQCSCIVKYEGLSGAQEEYSFGTGQAVEVSSVNTNSPAEPDRCTNSNNIVTLTCNDQKEVVSNKSYDPKVHKYLKNNCVSEVYNCTVPTSGGELSLAWGSALTLAKELSPACGKSCETLSIHCKEGALYKSDLTTLITANDLAVYSASGTCSLPDCQCNVNNHLFDYGTEKDFYSMADGGCDAQACANGKVTLVCNDKKTVAIKNSSGSPAPYKYDQCNVAACACPLPFGNSLKSNSTTNFFRVEKATCGDNTACTNPNNRVSVSCTNSVLSNYDANTFKYQYCTPAVCSCDINGDEINFGTDIFVYKEAVPAAEASCASVLGSFRCESDGSIIPLDGKVLTEYPYNSCQSLSDSGNLGGTGGGTGNDEGPGSALRKRRAEGEGTAGLIPFCKEGVECSADNTQIITLPEQKRNPCLLPWGGGEVEMYASFTAFKKQCVVIPDKCSNHRQVRSCRFPVLSGDPHYKYPKCTEQASCD